jgi:hypothetical protein
MNQMTSVTFVVAMAAITALLVGIVMTVTQPIRVQAQDTWELTLTTRDVPKQYTKISFEVWKGNTDTGIKLASGLATTNKGFASEAFNVDWNSVGDVIAKRHGIRKWLQWAIPHCRQSVIS